MENRLKSTEAIIRRQDDFKKLKEEEKQSEKVIEQNQYQELLKRNQHLESRVKQLEDALMKVLN